jgi:hypothetical protein
LLQYGRKFTDRGPPGISPDGIFDHLFPAIQGDFLKAPPESEQIYLP